MKLLDEDTVNQIKSSLLYKTYSEGKLEGKIEGKDEMVKEMIIDQLEKRFGSISYLLREKIHLQTDLNILKSTALLVVECQSLEEFEKALQ